MIEFINELDRSTLEALYAIRDPHVVYFFIWISELGRAWTVYGLALCIALLLALRRHYAYATGLAISTVTSGIGILILKGLIERARPPVEFQAYLEVWYSFPSAHAALATAFYGFLAYLAWKIMRDPIGRYIALSTAIAAIILISFSRLYLGVHYLSDVVTGIIFGALCVLLGVWFVRIVHRP